MEGRKESSFPSSLLPFLPFFPSSLLPITKSVKRFVKHAHIRYFFILAFSCFLIFHVLRNTQHILGTGGNINGISNLRGKSPQ